MRRQYSESPEEALARLRISELPRHEGEHAAPPNGESDYGLSARPPGPQSTTPQLEVFDVGG